MKHPSKDIKEAVGYMGLELELGARLGLWNGKGPHVPSLESLVMILHPQWNVHLSRNNGRGENQGRVGEIGL